MSYTQEVEDKYFSFADDDMYKARVALENTSEDASAEEWKKKIVEVAEEYCYSFRYFLIRFLKQNKKEEIPSMAEIKSLTEEQVKKYEEDLYELAKGRAGFAADRAEQLICKAMLDSKKKTKKKELLMTREEAFELGHILGFSLEQMKSCLLRVLENEDGFSLKRSTDLIEAYGFLQNLSAREVQEIKRAYEELTDDIEKVATDNYEIRFTKELESSIVTKVKEWNVYRAEERDQRFLEWLEEKSPYLDTISRTALRIYRNLSAYAYDLITDQAEFPSEEDLLDCIKEVTNNPEETSHARQYFYDEKGKVSKKECKKIVDTFVDIDTWKIVNAGTDGKPKSNTCADRIASILIGKISPQKADILYMLWFIESTCWNVRKEHSDEDLFNRIADLFDLADDTLRLAILPEFYPPHLLEQSMLLSIVNSKNQNPADIYEIICDALVAKKNKTTGARKHSKEEKLKAVLEFIDNPKNIKEICEKYEVSNKSLYSWRAKYLKGIADK